MTPINLLPQDFQTHRRCQRARYLWTNVVVGVVAVWIGTAAMVAVRHGRFAQNCGRLAQEVAPIVTAKAETKVFAEKAKALDVQRTRWRSLMPAHHLLEPMAELAAIRRASGAEGLVYAAISSEGNQPFEIVVRADDENIRRWRESFAEHSRDPSATDHPLVIEMLPPGRRGSGRLDRRRQDVEPEPGLWIHGDLGSLRTIGDRWDDRVARQDQIANQNRVAKQKQIVATGELDRG